jgi:hypothetical protein
MSSDITARLTTDNEWFPFLAARGSDELNLPEPERGQAGEVRDTQVLSSVLAFLRGDQDELLWRSVLSARTERAEADFAAGRVYTQEQAAAHFKAKRAPKPAP